jgi:hypothetical protein
MSMFANLATYGRSIMPTHNSARTRNLMDCLPAASLKAM